MGRREFPDYVPDNHQIQDVINSLVNQRPRPDQPSSQRKAYVNWNYQHEYGRDWRETDNVCGDGLEESDIDTATHGEIEYEMDNSDLPEIDQRLQDIWIDAETASPTGELSDLNELIKNVWIENNLLEEY